VLTPEAGLALLNQYANMKDLKKKGKSEIESVRTPLGDDVNSMQGQESAVRSNPQMKKRQHKTANCVICLSSLIPRHFFERPLVTPKPSKLSDTDNLLQSTDTNMLQGKFDKFKDKNKIKSSERSSVLANPNLVQLPNCGHLFHEECIKRWDCYSCPICRTKVDVNRRSLIMRETDVKTPEPTAVPLNQLLDPSEAQNDGLSVEELKIEVRKSEGPSEGGFPFQQSIRSSSNRIGMLSANQKAQLSQVRNIPVLGCLEEGKDEDG
jgi:hypothetical protein